MKFFSFDGLLPVTPPPREGESILGYSLRLAEENGYPSPWEVFEIAEVPTGQMLATTLPPEKIAAVVGWPVEKIRRLSWVNVDQAKANSDQKSRLSVIRNSLDFRRPKICPHCIEEQGIAQAAWELRMMVACPKHKVSLISRCQECDRELSWFRPGLIKCKCGARIAGHIGEPIPELVLDLLSVVQDAVSDRISAQQTPAGLPGADLSRSGIGDLLRLINSLIYHLSDQLSSVSSSQPIYSIATLESVARLLVDWPHNFHQWLNNKEATQQSRDYGIARRFEHIYKPLAVAQREAFPFVREGFISYKKYRIQELVKSGVSAEGKATEDFDVVSLADAARKLNVQIRVARTWAKQQLFGLSLIPNSPKGSTLVKLPKNIPIKDATGGIELRAAGRYLGIPVSILVRLRQDNLFTLTHIPRFAKQFHIRNLEEIEHQFLALAQKKLRHKKLDHITIQDLGSRRFGSPEVKYRVYRAILEGKLPPIGRLDDSIRDIVLHRRDVENIGNQFREEALTHLTATAAGKQLACSSTAASELLAKGYLAGYMSGTVSRIEVNSVKKFDDQYVSLGWISKQLGRSVGSIRKRMLKREIALIQVAGHQEGLHQYFCKRELYDGMERSLRQQC